MPTALLPGDTTIRFVYYEGFDSREQCQLREGQIDVHSLDSQMPTRKSGPKDLC